MFEPEKKCEYCGEIFSPLKYWQIYCNSDCKMGAYYERKRKRKLAQQNPLDDLDIPTGPTELQQADRQRRRDLTQEREQAKIPDLFADMDIYKHEKREEEIRKAKATFESTYSPSSYSPDRPAYPKIAKEREDAAKAAEQQRLQQQDQHGPDMARDATGPQESEPLRVSAQKGEKET